MHSKNYLLPKGITFPLLIISPLFLPFFLLLHAPHFSAYFLISNIPLSSSSIISLSPFNSSHNNLPSQALFLFLLTLANFLFIAPLLPTLTLLPSKHRPIHSLHPRGDITFPRSWKIFRILSRWTRLDYSQLRRSSMATQVVDTWNEVERGEVSQASRRGSVGSLRARVATGGHWSTKGWTSSRASSMASRWMNETLAQFCTPL